MKSPIPQLLRGGGDGDEGCPHPSTSLLRSPPAPLETCGTGPTSSPGKGSHQQVRDSPQRWNKVQGAAESWGLDMLGGIQGDTRGPWAATSYELAQTYFTIFTGITVLGIAAQPQTLGLPGEPWPGLSRHDREGV